MVTKIKGEKMKELVYKRALKFACEKVCVAPTKDHEQLFLLGMAFGVEQSKKILLKIGDKK